ncbi:MAG: hypothetical protein ABSA54_16520 [Terriglobales bacterium]|jgi:hypothetical protein
MRDGIYKSLKLGQGWKSLLKSCEREKERGGTASGKARNAIAKDLYIEVSAVFVHELLVRVRPTDLLPGFRSIDPELTCRDLGGNNSPLENDVLASAKRLEGLGIRGRAIVDQALGESLKRHKQARVLQIEQHCLNEAGLKSRPIIEAARQALLHTEIPDVIENLLQGKRLKLSRPKRPIHPDESLESVN